MDMALLIEEKNEVLTKKGSSWRDMGGTLRIKDPGDYSGFKKVDDKGNGKLKGRRLGLAELEERSKKGMCFKCGDKWNREHICKLKHMSLNLCENNSDKEEDVEEVKGKQVKSGEVVEEFQTL